MWLRNYYNMLTALFLSDDTLTSSSQPSDYDPPIMYHMLNGAWRDARYQASASNMSNYRSVVGLFAGKMSAQLITSTSGNSAKFGICLGKGTTAATYDDYALESIIASGLTLVTEAGTLKQATTYDSSSHHISSERSFTVNNSSSDVITINEIGLTFSCGYASTNASDFHALMFREVLEAPVLLNPSESIIVSFTRDGEVFNYTPYSS